MASIYTKWMGAVRQLGLKRTMEAAYAMGDVKFGTLIGADKWGNKYYENLDYPFGQHRWVEYADIHNYDAAMISPDWHGWMHHMTDSPGTDSAGYLEQKLKDAIQIGTDSNAPYTDHVGKQDYEDEFMHNWSQFRHRGYKMGSLHMDGTEEERFWTQPGHMLNDLNTKTTAYNRPEAKNVTYADLEDPNTPVPPQPKGL